MVLWELKGYTTPADSNKHTKYFLTLWLLHVYYIYLTVFLGIW